ALPEFLSAAAPTFARGAVIRTILKDYPPDDLAGGATLFHEHMSFANDFMTRCNGYAAETRAANGLSGGASGGGRGAGGAGGGARGGEGAGAASTAPFFMQDADLMDEELRIA